MSDIKDDEMSTIAVRVHSRNNMPTQTKIKHIELCINDTISVLRYLESRECRRVMSKDIINNKRKYINDVINNMRYLKNNVIIIKKKKKIKKIKKVKNIKKVKKVKKKVNDKCYNDDIYIK